MSESFHDSLPKRLLAKVARGTYLALADTKIDHGGSESQPEENLFDHEWHELSPEGAALRDSSYPGIPDGADAVEEDETVDSIGMPSYRATARSPGRSLDDPGVAGNARTPARENVMEATRPEAEEKSFPVAEMEQAKHRAPYARSGVVPELLSGDETMQKGNRTPALAHSSPAEAAPRQSAEIKATHHFRAESFSRRPQPESHVTLKPLFSGAAASGKDIGGVDRSRSEGGKGRWTVEAEADTRPIPEQATPEKSAEQVGPLPDPARVPERAARAPIYKGTASVETRDANREEQQSIKKSLAAVGKVRAVSEAARFPEQYHEKAAPVAPPKEGGIPAPTMSGAAAGKGEAPRRLTGSVKVGSVNINIRGKERPEPEPWPEAPQYADHMITDEWEWSCRYGR